MSLYSLYDSTDDLRNLPQAVEKITKGLEHAKKSGKKEMVHKMEGILHKLKSYNSKTFEEAIRETEKEIEAIEKTSDKFGKETAIGDLNFLKARAERKPAQRISLLEESAKFYEKAGMTQRASQLKGDVFQIKGNITSPQDKKHAEYYKKASVEYGKAGNKRMEKWLEGHYEVALATKLGILVDNKEEFEKHLLSANHSYKEAGNVRGVQFTAGVGLFLEAVRAEYPKSIKLLEASAHCLESVGERFLSSFAKSEISQQLTSKAKTREERVRLMREEKNHLERAVIESDKKSSKQEVNFPIGEVVVSSDILKGLNRARLHELNGFLEEDRDLSKKHFLRAKQEYLSLENCGAFQMQILPGIAWVNLFLEDIVGAKEYFNKVKAIKPESAHVEKGMEAVDKLIEVKYSQETNDYLIKTRLSIPLLQHLSDDVFLVRDDKPYPSRFFNLCLAIVKKSCGQIERYRSDFINESEPSLRNKVLIFSNSLASDGLGTSLTGESFTCEGKSDIFAVNPRDDKDCFIGECKIWSGNSGYEGGFNQLVARYLSSADKAGVLVNFVKKGNMRDIVEKAINAIKEKDKKAKIVKIDNKNFVSTHDEYGMIFHHLVDLIPSK